MDMWELYGVLCQHAKAQQRVLWLDRRRHFNPGLCYRAVPVSACLVALGLVWASQAQTPWMFYIALGLGILLVVSLAQMCLLHLGWRWAYGILATIVVAGVMPPTWLWQRARPEDLDLLPDGDVSEPPPRRSATSATWYSSTSRAHQGWTLRAALRTPTLWLLFAMRIFTPLGMMMVVPHHVAYLIGQGFSKPVAALAFSALGLLSFTGRIFFGLLSDRLGQTITPILTSSLAIIGTLLLLSLHDPEHRWRPGVTSLCMALALGRVVRSLPPWRRNCFIGRIGEPSWDSSRLARG